MDAERIAFVCGMQKEKIDWVFKTAQECYDNICDKLILETETGPVLAVIEEIQLDLERLHNAITAEAEKRERR